MAVINLVLHTPTYNTYNNVMMRSVYILKILGNIVNVETAIIYFIHNFIHLRAADQANTIHWCHIIKLLLLN